MKHELWQLTIHEAYELLKRKESLSLELAEAVLCHTEVEEKSRAFALTLPLILCANRLIGRTKGPLPRDFLSVTSILVQYQAPRLYKRDGYSLQLAGAVESDSLAALQRWKRETGIAMVGKNMDEFMVTISERKEA